MKAAIFNLFRSSVFVLVCLNAPLALAASSKHSSSSATPSADREALSLKDAEAIALRAVPGGKVLSVERDVEWGRSVFEVEMLDAEGWQVDLLIDAGDGKVLRQKRDD